MTANTKKTKVLLLFGGVSGEHSISCVTAYSVLQVLDRDKYEPLPVGITKNGRWAYMDPDNFHASLDGERLPEILEVTTPARLDVTGGSKELTIVKDGQEESLGVIDVVFPLLHGPFGEDGTIQGMLEIAAIPYVGCGVVSSAVGMDKHFMKQAFTAAGLKVGPYAVVHNKEYNRDPEAALTKMETLGYPVFVKPARGGSSLGINRANNRQELVKAIEQARIHDPKLIIEKAIEGREIECAVLEGRGYDRARASYPGEIVVTGGDEEFYDFDAKYRNQTASELYCPADLPQEAQQRIREKAIRGFEAIDGEGLSRVDFFYTNDGEFLINEVNTLPGFTPKSMYPQMWEKTGIAYPDLVDELLTLALERPIGLR